MNSVLHQIGEDNSQADDKLVYGIDLGTSTCVVSWYDTISNKLQYLTGLEGGIAIPSVIHFSKNLTMEIGSMVPDTNLVISSAKRLLGLTHDEYLSLKTDIPFPTSYREGVGVAIHLDDSHTVFPETMLRFLLNHILELLHKKKSISGVQKAVISVPAWFNEGQRKLVHEAAMLSGWQVLALLSEPTAAAIAYLQDKSGDDTYLVVDCGGGTTDISAVSRQSGVFLVTYTKGNNQLGGDDIDAALANHFDKKDTFDRQLIRVAKEKFSTTKNQSIEFKIDGKTKTLTHDSIPVIAKDFFNRFTMLCTEVKNELSHMDIAIDAVIATGGTFLLPAASNHLQSCFPEIPVYKNYPHTAVSQGAAIHARNLHHTEEHDQHLIDCLNLSLGLETYGGVMEVLIPRLSILPAFGEETFTTWADFQTGMDFTIYQGENELVKNNRKIGVSSLKGLPKKLSGQVQVVVRFEISVDGLLSISASEKSSGPSSFYQISVQMSGDYQSEKRADFETAQLITEKLKARNIIEHLNTLTNVKIISQPISEALHALKNSIKSNDWKLINAHRLALEDQASNFAKEVINTTIQKSLVGKTISEITSQND